MAYPDVRVYIDFTSDALAAATNWVDVTADVVDLETEWGRSSLVDEFQPGGGSLTLRSFDGRYDPANEAGPYYGLLLPRRRIKVEVPVVDEAEYSDDFEDGTIGSGWTAEGTVTESGGSLAVSDTVSNGLSRVRRTANFEDRAVTVDCGVVSTASDTVFGTPVGVLFTQGYAEFTLFRSGGALLIRATAHTPDGTTWLSLADEYTVGAHRWMRIRHHGTQTHWEVSGDGSSWTTMMALDVAWEDMPTAQVHCSVGRIGAGGSMTISLRELTIRHQLTHPISYGWVKGWPTRQTWRTQQHVDLEWQDALGVLGTVELPDSVWDHRIRSLGPAAWYRLDDEADTAADLTGNGHHASWRAFGGATTPQLGTVVPPSVRKAGKVESLVPLANTGATSFARMLAELGQSVTLTDPPRSVGVVCPDSLSGLLNDRSATVEMWCMARPAFPLAITGVPSSTTTIYQALVTWGAPGSQWVEVGISDDGLPYVGAASPSSVWGDAEVSYSATSVGYPFHLVVVFFPNGSGLGARVYINGSLIDTIDLGVIAIPTGPPVIGYAMASTTSGGARQLQSTIGDVVFYDRSLTAGEVASNHQAGQYGSLDAIYLGAAPASALIAQTLDIAGYQVPHRVDTWGEVYSYQPFWAQPGKLDRRTAIEYCRQLAASGAEPFYQARDGALELLPRGWPFLAGRASVSQARLGDDPASTVGYTELDFSWDAETIINDCTVKWVGGEQRAAHQASIATYGPLRDQVDTQLAHPDAALQLASWRVNTRGAVRRLVSRPLHLQPATDDDFDTVLRLDFASRVTLVRTTPDGREIEADYWVQAIRHRIEPGQGQWDTYLTLEPADVPGPIFRFGVSMFGGPDVFTL